MIARALLGVVLVTGVVACHSTGAAISSATGSSPTGTGATGTGAASTGAGPSGGAGVGGAGDAGPIVGPSTNPCPTTTNPPGTVVDLTWPSTQNIGPSLSPGDTLHFTWSGGSPHNVLEVPLWAPLDNGMYPAPGGEFGDSHYAGEIRSGAPTAGGAFDWNTGTLPCGYRPGIYFFVDENNPASGPVAVNLTDANTDNAHYAAQPCKALASDQSYEGRYVAYASRPGCTQYEVNNFQTQAHFDWVQQPQFPGYLGPNTPTIGDVIVFRWTGLHNVVQVHDVTSDELVPGGFYSGPRTTCMGGPNYNCGNGDWSLGESLIDTENHRPGMIHISDGCALGCASCPWQCQGAQMNATGQNIEFVLQRPVRPVVPAVGAGTCCAVDPSKGQACRLIDVFNDNQGLQFDSYFGVNYGDLVRFRWTGNVKIIMATLDAKGNPTETPLSAGGPFSMPDFVDCVAGPNWSCLNGTTAQAELIFDVAKATDAGAIVNGSFPFYAFGTKTPGFSSNDSGIVIGQQMTTPYSSNPPCADAGAP